MLRKTIRDYFTRRTIHKKYPSLQLEGFIHINGSIDNMKIGNACTFANNIYIHLGGFEWDGYSGKLDIGSHCHFGPNVVIYAAGQFGVKIGNDFDCGPATKIFASKFKIDHVTSRDFKKVTIGNRVACGSNVVFNPGVSVGNDVVIGANSIVLQDLPSNGFYAGNPAKFIRNIDKRHV